MGVMQEEIKKQISLSAESRFRGYQPLGANVTRYENGFARDWHEGIDLYRESKVASKVSMSGRSQVHPAWSLHIQVILY